MRSHDACRYDDGDNEELGWEEVFGKKAKGIKGVNLPGGAAVSAAKKSTACKRKASEVTGEQPSPLSASLSPLDQA